MRDTNVVIMIGRLTRDIEMKYTSTGMTVGKMSVAVNDSKKGVNGWEDVVSFIDVTAFGKTFTGVQKWLTKGKQIAINGKLKQDRWIDGDGNKRYRVNVIANQIQLLSSGKGDQVTVQGNDEMFQPTGEDFDDGLDF